MHFVVIVTLLLAFATGASGAGAGAFPPPVALNTYPVMAVEAARFGEIEFPGRQQKEVRRGRIWRGDVMYQGKAGPNPRRALITMIDEMTAAGWEVMLRDEPGNPPLASLKYEKDGKEWWALISVYEHAKVTILEVGPPR